MTRYVLGRVLSAAIVLALLSIIVFAMVRLIPGDPAAALVDPANPDPAAIAQIRQQLGLDRPWWVQYSSWIGGLLTGDLGESLTKPYSVAEMVGTRLPVSIELAVLATVFGVLIGIPAGVLSARRTNGIADQSVRGLSFAFLATPPFALGTVLILVNSLTLKLKLIGYVPFAQDPAGNLGVMVLPSLLLGLVMAAIIARYMRGTLLGTFSQDFIRTARAKGASPSRVVNRHALRNALVPVTTIVGIELAGLVGGTVVTETVFSLPGIGTVLVDAIRSSDYPVIQACVLLLGLVYVVINFAVDLLYPLIDPRVRVVATA
ncbi:ABC transporter permease [Curtobacterium pusillum]|uniref:ABC transporter permease n=1 Tax=Curtobacterium pusillum TaxID=69373 RepID=UPI0037F48FA7